MLARPGFWPSSDLPVLLGTIICPSKRFLDPGTVTGRTTLDPESALPTQPPPESLREADFPAFFTALGGRGTRDLAIPLSGMAHAIVVITYLKLSQHLPPDALCVGDTRTSFFLCPFVKGSLARG